MVVINRQVCLENKYLCNDIEYWLLKKLRNMTENECTNENGYILSVDKLNRIVDTKISNANAVNVFTVEFEAETLRPVVGENLTGSVFKLFPKGIFIHVKNKLEVLIRLDDLNGYEFDSEKSTFTCGKKIIRKDDILTVKIVGVQYSKHRFTCYGSIV